MALDLQNASPIRSDTPINFVDRYFNRRHAEKFRKTIGVSASYGFYTKEKWEEIFSSLGFKVRTSRRLSRFCRNWRQPYARSVFILDVNP